jgi:hypothetical protein
MHYIEILAWIIVGFAPVVGIGIFKWSRYRKIEDEKIPWEI